MKYLSVVMIRIFALYYFLKTISGISSMISYLPVLMGTEMVQGNNGILSIGMVIIVNLSLCLLLWIFSDKIASMLVPKDAEFDKIKIDINYNNILVISIKIVGLVLIIVSLEEGLRELIAIIGVNLERFDIRQKAIILFDLLFPFVKIMIGIILISSDKVHSMVGLKQIIDQRQ